jgi:hypothetical protein
MPPTDIGQTSAENGEQELLWPVCSQQWDKGPSGWGTIGFAKEKEQLKSGAME